jgi:hypothetical protein
MIHKTQSPKPDHIRIVFELPSCIWADRIFLAGDFNDWSESSTPMRQERDGVWRASVDLPIGSRCQFRYLINGQWKTDYHADGFSTNEYGAENSVVDATLPNMLEEAERLSSQVWDGLPLRVPVVGAHHPFVQKSPQITEILRRSAATKKRVAV